MTNESLHISIPTDLKKDLKVIAVRKDENITCIIIQLLNQYVKDNKEFL